MQLNIGVLACSWGLKVVTSDFKKFCVTISCHVPCAPYPLLPLLLLSSPSSFDFLLHSLFPVFEPLFQLSLLTFVPFSPILFSISLLHSSTSCSFSPVFIFSNSLAFFHSLASFSHLSPSTQALHTKFIFTFPLSNPKPSPLIYCLHFSHSTKKSSPPFYYSFYSFFSHPQLNFY